MEEKNIAYSSPIPEETQARGWESGVDATKIIRSPAGGLP